MKMKVKVARPANEELRVLDSGELKFLVTYANTHIGEQVIIAVFAAKSLAEDFRDTQAKRNPNLYYFLREAAE